MTDHHQIPRDERDADVIPPALAVINPKRMDCHYPFKEFAGVGVAFKLVQALQHALSGTTDVERDILDLVAIGTVADMAPLIGENRALVKSGLSHVNEARRTGLMALMEQSRLRPGEITAGKIGFTLGPRLNAAGRLTDAKLAYHLLATQDRAEARDLAETLNQINMDRQQMTETIVAQARNQILAESRDDAPLYLVTDSGFNQGVVGLVASRLADEFYRPVFVAHRGEEVTKGSGRSIPEFNITGALDECADLLIKYGGHAAAAGFTVANENYEAFQTRLKEIAKSQLAHRELYRTLAVDAEINLRGVTFKLVEDIQALQPFGYSNPTPRFMTTGLTVRHQAVVGRDGNHLKLKLHDGKQIWDAIGFRMGQRWPPSKRLNRIDAVYTLEFNTWQGVTRLQLNLKDIRPSDT